jgi:hypothetical protein
MRVTHHAVSRAKQRGLISRGANRPEKKILHEIKQSKFREQIGPRAYKIYIPGFVAVVRDGKITTIYRPLNPVPVIVELRQERHKTTDTWVEKWNVSNRYTAEIEIKKRIHRINIVNRNKGLLLIGLVGFIFLEVQG